MSADRDRADPRRDGQGPTDGDLAGGLAGDRAAARYRRLRPLFPRIWRERHEDELLETLRELEGAGESAATAELLDLLGLAVALRRRELVDRLAARARFGGGSGGYLVRLRAAGPTAGVVALAALLLAPVLHLDGRIPPEFVLTSLLVVAVPGIGVIYTVSCALAGGRGRGLVAAIGCTLGIVPHLVVAALGLSGLMQLGAVAFETVRWAGVAYLAWMGLGMIRQRAGFRPDVAGAGVDGGSDVGTNGGGTSGDGVGGGAFQTVRVIVRGVLLNVLNPKLTLFFFAFLPQFLDLAPIGPGGTGAGGAGATVLDPRLIGLASLFMLLTLAGFVLYALAGAALRRLVRRTPSALGWAQSAFGALLLGFAARLALVER